MKFEVQFQSLSISEYQFDEPGQGVQSGETYIQRDSEGTCSALVESPP